MNYVTLESDGESIKNYFQIIFLKRFISKRREKITLPLQPVGEAGFVVKRKTFFSPNDVIPPRNSRKSTEK